MTPIFVFLLGMASSACKLYVTCFLYVQDEGAGDSQLINSVYLDNSSMELYHGRLDKKPNALALRIR